MPSKSEILRFRPIIILSIKLKAVVMPIEPKTAEFGFNINQVDYSQILFDSTA